jgi:glycolate oxidase iron-sulfur subunit
VGCLINYVYPNIAEALIDVLNKLNIEVVVPVFQVCCGIPARSLGDTTAARTLAEKNREVFEAERLDAIVTACSTCLLTIKKEYLRLLGESWRPMTEKMYDISVFLEKFTQYQPEQLKTTVTYHDPCHLKWGLNTTREPRKVLSRCANFKEMEYPDRCCGGGGIFSLIYRDLSLKIGEHKINSVEKSGARTVATSCPGCVLQIADLAASKDLNVETLHVVELLSRTLNHNPSVPTGELAQVSAGP